MLLTNLADILRGAGLKVHEVPGWKSHHHGHMGEIQGIMWHHTAGAASGWYPSLDVVRNGRPGLPGPLSQLGLARDGTWIVISSGMAWHAGNGDYPGFTGWGNNHIIGVEAENTGTGQPWPAEQIESYRRGTAAILKAFDLPASRCIGHKEWATPRGRKIDPYGLNMDYERGQVDEYMRHGIAEPGGIEEMAFNDTYKDWAGNDQSVLSWMNHVDRRMWEMHNALLGLQQSRIPGDDNQTNVVNAIMDSTAWQAMDLGHSVAARAAAEAAADELEMKRPSLVSDGETSFTQGEYAVFSDKNDYDNAKRLDKVEAVLDEILTVLKAKG